MHGSSGAERGARELRNPCCEPLLQTLSYCILSFFHSSNIHLTSISYETGLAQPIHMHPYCCGKSVGCSEPFYEGWLYTCLLWAPCRGRITFYPGNFTWNKRDQHLPLFRSGFSQSKGLEGSPLLVPICLSEHAASSFQIAYILWLKRPSPL